MTNPALLRREQARHVVTAPQGKEKRPPVLPPSDKRTIDCRDQSTVDFLDRSQAMVKAVSGERVPDD